jgi:uncharacterized protein YjbJ (UPF0337 family)
MHLDTLRRSKVRKCIGEPKGKWTIGSSRRHFREWWNMDKDRIVGSAKDFAGKVESAVGGMAGDAKTETAGRVHEATGSAQNLYGQAKDAASKASDAAVSYAKDAFDSGGDTFRDGSQAIAKQVQEKPARLGADCRRDRLCAGSAYDAPTAALAATYALFWLG